MDLDIEHGIQDETLPWSMSHETVDDNIFVCIVWDSSKHDIDVTHRRVSAK